MKADPLSRLLRLLPLAALGLALAGGSASDASASTAQAEHTEPSATIDAPFLWKIDGGAKPSFLFGTIHAGVDASELPPLVDNALQESPIFVMETSPGDVYPPAPGLAYPMGMPMDMRLANAAHHAGARVGTLESMGFQLSLLRKLGSAQELAAILADDSEAIEPLVSAYRAGDLDAISEVTQMGDASMREVLLTQRNHRWVHKLGRLLAHGGAFIAVGVGHIPGEDGLLDLLDQRGFSISRMS